MAKVQTNMAQAMIKAVVNCVNSGGNPKVVGRVVLKDAAKHNVMLPYMGRRVQYIGKVTIAPAETAVKNVGVQA